MLQVFEMASVGIMSRELTNDDIDISKTIRIHFLQYFKDCRFKIFDDFTEIKSTNIHADS